MTAMNQPQGVTMAAPTFFATPGYGETQLAAMHYSQAVRIGDRVETSSQGSGGNR
jgi:hypothetical protein